MKKIVLAAILIAAAFTTRAQVISPVTWSFTAKKIADKTYEVHATANVQNGWHLYAQVQPEDAVVNPTEYLFKANPLFSLDGKAKEVGKMELVKDSRLGISANQYSGNVDFVQKIKLKANVKTTAVGSIEFQTCNDKRCLPAKKVDFSVALQ